MALDTDGYEIATQLLLKLILDLREQTVPVKLATLPLEIFPLCTFLDFMEVDGEEIDTEALKLSCVMRMSHQVKVHHVLWLHELLEDVLAQLCQLTDHEIVGVDEQAQEKGQVALRLTEVVRVEELNYGRKVLLRDAFDDNIANPSGLGVSLVILTVSECTLLGGALLEAILGVEHDPEVLAAGVQNSTVRTHQVVAVKLEHNIKEVVQVAALGHLRVYDVILLFNPIFR